MSTGDTEEAPRSTAESTHGDFIVTGVSKRYGGVPALSDVSLTISPGTVHALVGENGAGKSTLGKIMSGVIAPDEGTMSLGGEALSFKSPRDALSHGIATIVQELAIVPGLTVAENVYLGVEPSTVGFVRRRQSRRQLRDLAKTVGFDLSPDRRAGSLSIADQQKVEIMRALSRDASIVIMDEPTAALSGGETKALHGIIRSLVRDGNSVVLISHYLSEVLALADVITTLRDGHLIRTVDAKDATEETLIEGMLGRSLSSAFPEKIVVQDERPVVLEVEHLQAPGVNDCSFVLHEGEILGIAGLVGAGRSELARAIFRDSKVSGGSVRLKGRDLGGHSPSRSIRRGLVFIPESRKEMGLLVGRSVKENVSLSRLDLVSRLGWIAGIRERRKVNGLIKFVTVRAASIRMPVSMLSGGNQQKLLFARSVMCSPDVLIADEPTRGVDVGSKRTIYDILTDMASSGMGVVVISSDLEEVLGLAHRVLVMRHGRIITELSGEGINEQSVLAAAFAESTSKGVIGS